MAAEERGGSGCGETAKNPIDEAGSSPTSFGPQLRELVDMNGSGG